MEPTPRYIAFAGEVIETVPDRGLVRLFRVIVNIRKLAEHHGIDSVGSGLGFHLIAQAAHEERDALAGRDGEEMRFPLSGSVAEPVVVDVNYVQFTWLVL